MNKEYFFKRLAVNQPSALESYSYDLLPVTFLAHDKIPIICHLHGVFYQKAYSHLSGQGCSICGEVKCRNGRAHSTEEFVFKSMSRFGNKFDYSKTKYRRQDEELT